MCTTGATTLPPECNFSALALLVTDWLIIGCIKFKGKYFMCRAYARQDQDQQYIYINCTSRTEEWDNQGNTIKKYLELCRKT